VLTQFVAATDSFSGDVNWTGNALQKIKKGKNTDGRKDWEKWKRIFISLTSYNMEMTERT
jgi:hypothetical protein